MKHGGFIAGQAQIPAPPAPSLQWAWKLSLAEEPKAEPPTKDLPANFSKKIFTREKPHEPPGFLPQTVPVGIRKA